MKYKAQLMDEAGLSRALTRLSYEIVEKTPSVDNLVLVGIRTRGIPMAKIIRDNIEKHTGVRVPFSELDITLYRDDLTALSENPLVGKVDLGQDITDKEIILVDDVLFTGRTARAAIEALFSVGRPGKIRLAVLIDRGHRELPIRPDYVGKNIPTSLKEIIKVNFREVDGKTNVEIYNQEE